MGDVGKTTLILAVTINVGSRDAEVRRGRLRGSIDPVVHYQAFHARSGWYITMIFIMIPYLPQLSAIPARNLHIKLPLQ
jgi:hypothetical protein